MILISTSLNACAPRDDLAVSIATPAADAYNSRESEDSEVFDLARRHDEQALLARSLSSSTSHDASVPPKPAIALALLTIDRKRYAKAFVSAYPSDRETLMQTFGPSFERARIGGRDARFPIAVLGATAIAGDDRAFTRLLGAISVTDGSIGRAYQIEAEHVIAARPPAATLDALSALSSASRLSVVASIDWCVRSPKAILAFRATPAPASPKAGSSSPTSRPSRLETEEQITLIQADIAHAAYVDCTIGHVTALARKGRRVHAHLRTASSKKPKAGLQSR